MGKQKTRENARTAILLVAATIILIAYIAVGIVLKLRYDDVSLLQWILYGVAGLFIVVGIVIAFWGYFLNAKVTGKVKTVIVSGDSEKESDANVKNLNVYNIYNTTIGATLDEKEKNVNYEEVVQDEYQPKEAEENEVKLVNDGMMVVPENSIVINPEATKRKTMQELLEDEGKLYTKYYNRLIAYAMSKEGAEKGEHTYFTSIKLKKKKTMKFTISKESVVSTFHLENDLLRDYTKGGGKKVSVKDAVVKVNSDETFDCAKELIDLCVEDVDRLLEIEKQRKLEKRRQQREMKKALAEQQNDEQQ